MAINLLPMWRGLLGVMLLALSGGVLQAERPDIGPLLEQAKLAEAHTLLAAHLESDDDPTARFQLGFVEFLQAIEGLGQDCYRYGLTQRYLQLPLLRMAVPATPEPQPMTYDDLRAMVLRFERQLATAEATLAKVGDAEVKWHLSLDRVALDFNQDGEIAPAERLWNIFVQVERLANRGENLKAPTLGLDTADVYWLRGYCHTLSATADMMLAHDMSRLFEFKGYLLFRGADAPYEKLGVDRRFDMSWFIELASFIHLLQFDVAEPQRMADAHEHMLQVIAMSRKSFEHVLTETDDDQEWIPAPQQTPSLPRAGLTHEQIDGWHEVLAEAEALLKGEKLIPYWRGGERGVNLHRVFHDPRPFDLVLWLDGASALPYLEEGELSTPEAWRRFQTIFGNNLLGFSLWIN